MKVKFAFILLLCAFIAKAEDDTPFRVSVMNKLNRSPIDGAKVTMQDIVSLRVYTETTNDSGFANFKVDKNLRYRLEVSKDAMGGSIGFMGYSYMIAGLELSNGRTFEVELEKIRRTDFGLITAMTFQYNKAELSAENKTSLDNAGNMLKQFPTLRMEISVHSDCREAQSLTVARAEAITKYMADKGFIRQIAVKKYFSTRPVNYCDCTSTLIKCTDDNYNENRRGEFKVLSF